jgi:hypothetical protein
VSSEAEQRSHRRLIVALVVIAIVVLVVVPFVLGNTLTAD